MSDQRRGRAFWVYAVAAAALIGWIGVKTQITANRQEADSQATMQFSDQTRDCLHQLLDALAARSVIAENSERLNSDQNKA